VRQQKEVLCQRSLPISEERMQMIQEHKNFVARQQRIALFTRKARIGYERKQQRQERQRLEKKRIREWEDKTRLAMQRLAATVQRIYRGYIGRKTVKNLKLEKQKAEWAIAFLNSCATEIERTWRGSCGRRDAKRLRKEMSEFMFAIRAKEAEAEEDEFAKQSFNRDYYH